MSETYIDRTFEYEDLDESLAFDPDEPLFQSLSTQVILGIAITADHCVNAIRLKSLFEDDRFPSSSRDVLKRLQQSCIAAGIRKCSNEMCAERRQCMDQSAPHCDWLLYRNWVLTAMSCLAGTYPMLQSYVEGLHYPFPMHWGDNIVQRLEDQREDPYPLDVFGLAELTLWMLEMAIALYPPLEIPSRFSVHPLYMEKDCYTLGIQKALARANALRICPYRLWNLAVSSKYGDFDLASLVDLVDRSIHRICFRQANHDDCTSENCQMADNNSTVLEQLHVCHNHACGTSTFPSSLLDNSIDCSVWRLSDQANHLPRLYEGNDYAALSHVWSDGTGVGIGRPGHVNTCLVGYFDAVLKRVDCDGLWWDIISVPTERKARTRALNHMHENYRRAKCTIIHDRSLLQFPWADDGSPCVALLLSPWFTRAWTALELTMSKSVKVLYRGVDENTPLIKDLDKDILTQDRSINSRGHIVASSIIRRLRGTIVDSLADVHTVLGTRATSYPRDRLIIANLLRGLPIPEQQISQSQLTRNLFGSFHHIPPSFLLHGHATLQDSGPWSWCPPNLFYGQTAGQQRAIRANQYKYRIQRSGTAFCIGEMGLLTEKTASEIRPYAYHISVTSKIKAALQQWQICLLVRLLDVVERSQPRLAILAQPFAIGNDENGQPILDCNYVGTVYDQEPYIRWPDSRNDIRFGLAPQPTLDTAEKLRERFVRIVDKIRHEYTYLSNPTGNNHNQSFSLEKRKAPVTLKVAFQPDKK